ncbi:MAG: hypothetical protein ACR2RB_12315 [Gammaproteobacteria bacterium]
MTSNVSESEFSAVETSLIETDAGIGADTGSGALPTPPPPPPQAVKASTKMLAPTSLMPFDNVSMEQLLSVEHGADVRAAAVTPSLVQTGRIVIVSGTGFVPLVIPLP